MRTPDTSNDMAAAFDAGDYMRVALEGRPEQWQFHAARGLINSPEAGIAALQHFDHPSARFYSAVLAWMAGHDDEAVRGLADLQDQHAQNLRALISKPQIKVLAQLPPVRHGAHVLAYGARHDKKFKIANIGYLEGDIANAPYRSVHNLTGSLGTPDFYTCYAVEWHQIPVDLQELACPTIGFTSDFDIHIQSVARWLPIFDYRVVIDHVDSWSKVAAIGGGPTVSYPMVFGIPENVPFRERERDIDVFVSGTMLAAYHPDKALLLHQLFSVPGIKMVVVDGHLAPDAYMDIMARSKISPTFCRFPGSMQTRVLEALAVGTVSLVQPNSIMKLWFDESNGLFEYNEKTGPGPAIERILSDYPRIGAACMNAVATAREAFAPARVASRYLRFCTFLAAKSRRSPAPLDPWLNQKRVHFAHGIELSPDVATELAKRNYERLSEEYGAAPSARVLLDRAREGLLLYARALYDNHPDNVFPSYLEMAVADLRMACAEFPNSLVAHFNLLRVLAHFDTSDDRRDAERLATTILDRTRESWCVDPHDDVLPYDLFSNWFDYRAYLDKVVDRLAGGNMPDAAFVDLILASVSYYAAVLTGSLEHAARSVELDPVFPFYKLYLAETLARQPRRDQQERAEELLRELATSSMVAVRAYEQLRALSERRTSPMPDDLAARVHHMERVVLQTEHHYLKVASPYFKLENLRVGGLLGPRVNKSGPREHPPEISVVIGGRAGTDCVALLSSLHNQDVARSRFEVLYVDCYDLPDDSILRLSDWSASLNQRDLLDHRANALAFAIDHCRSEVVAVITPGEAMATSFVGNLITAFYGSPRRELRIARSLLIIAPAERESDRIRALAFRLKDYRRVGGLEQREIFMGNDAGLDDLAARLYVARVPALVLRDSRMVLRHIQPWWRANPHARSPELLEISRHIQPELFEKKLMYRGNLQPPRLLEEHRDTNIVWYNNMYYVAPHQLREPDWSAIAANGHPLVFCTKSLDEARRVARKGVV